MKQVTTYFQLDDNHEWIEYIDDSSGSYRMRRVYNWGNTNDNPSGTYYMYCQMRMWGKRDDYIQVRYWVAD